MKNSGLDGALIDKEVILGKDAIEELYNKSYYGRPKDHLLKLSLVEAAHLIYRNKINIISNGETLSFEEFFKIASQLAPNFELKYIVFKDLRERGYYIQPSVTDFRLYPRGGHPGKTAAEFFVHVLSERIPLPLVDLIKPLNTAENMRKRMALAIVDEESDITFYEVKKTILKGNSDIKLKRQKSEKTATLLEDRVIIWDSEFSNYLHNNGFFGKPLDESRLQLSLVESAYLLNKSIIKIVDGKSGNTLDFKDFSSRATEIEPEFFRKYWVYKDLRENGLVVKTGFKFGSHFRVYKQVKSLDKMPHSEYLVHAIPIDYVFSLQVMSRAIRLAQSVRKRMIFACVNDNDVEYIDIGRLKP